jgi:hypothetical protein
MRIGRDNFAAFKDQEPVAAFQKDAATVLL